MQKVHGYVLETRNVCETGSRGQQLPEEEKSAQIALASACFLDPQTGPALLIRRARDAARTARTHVTHVTRRVRVTR